MRASAASLAVPIALAALVAAGELVCLRPLGRAPRPLSFVVMLVALHALPLPTAAIAIAAGELVALVSHLDLSVFAKRVVLAATMTGAYGALSAYGSGTATTATTLATLVGACVAALAVAELLETRGRMHLHPDQRLADLALLASAPLIALGTVGTDARAGLGLGALPVLVVPLALLTHGYIRAQRAHENLFAWLRAVSVAPEHAALVPRGHAERVVHHARTLADRLDAPMREQLEAAAWMERVGECCLDDPRAIGHAHPPADITDASAEILTSCRAFEPAVRILRASFREEADDTTDMIQRASHILREAIARADDDEREGLDRLLLAPSSESACATLTTS